MPSFFEVDSFLDLTPSDVSDVDGFASFATVAVPQTAASGHGVFVFSVDPEDAGEKIALLPDVVTVTMAGYEDRGPLFVLAEVMASATYWASYHVTDQDHHVVDEGFVLLGGNSSPQTDQILAGMYPDALHFDDFATSTVPFFPDNLVYTDAFGNTYTKTFDSLYLVVNVQQPDFDVEAGIDVAPYVYDGRLLITTGPLTGQRDFYWGDWINTVSIDGPPPAIDPWDDPSVNLFQDVDTYAASPSPDGGASAAVSGLVFDEASQTAYWRGGDGSLDASVPLTTYMSGYTGQGHSYDEAESNVVSGVASSVAVDSYLLWVQATTDSSVTPVAASFASQVSTSISVRQALMDFSQSNYQLFTESLAAFDNGDPLPDIDQRLRENGAKLATDAGIAFSGIVGTVGQAAVNGLNNVANRFNGMVSILSRHSDLSFKATVAENDDAQVAVLGDGHDDVFIGGMFANKLDFGDGSDVAYGGGGDDELLGGSDRDLLFGGNDQDLLAGGPGDDGLYGGNGNDLLNGGGGLDVMVGGAGDDTYVVDTAGDRIIENSGEGNDQVRTSLNYTLGANFESLWLTGTENRNGNGNKLDNVLIGNVGSNLLQGYEGDDRLDGGLGADRMVGGPGNDTFVVNNTGDRVVEANNQGTDTVESTISFALTGLYVENLTLMGGGETAGGNGFSNVLTGTGGANTLNGGLNADTMVGGAGNDLYFVDNIGDVVVENVNGGTDAVNASITYTLGDNVETLVLTGYQAINGTGNALNNTVTGNGNANVLNGGAGKDILIGQGGNDTLTGGAGADQFRFYAAGAANGFDHVIDFVSGTDRLAFTAKDYGFAKGHVLTSAELHVGAAVGTNGQFLYNSVNHILYWDADGAGGNAAVAVAVFDNAARPVAGDFVLL